jgi:hypothetical protein
MLMISIVVAAAFVIYVYSSGVLGSLQGAQPQQPYTNQITLEYYSWPNSSRTYPNNMHTLTLNFRNTGTGRAILADFFVNGTAVTLSSTTGSCFTYTRTNTFLPPGSTCVAVLTIDPSIRITAGYAYAVRLVTRDGSVFTYTLTAGQSGTPS